MGIRSARDERGVAAVEYGVLVALVAVAIVGGVRALSGSVEGAFAASAQQLDAEEQAAADGDEVEGADDADDAEGEASGGGDDDADPDDAEGDADDADDADPADDADAADDQGSDAAPDPDAGDDGASGGSSGTGSGGGSSDSGTGSDPDSTSGGGTSTGSDGSSGGTDAGTDDDDEELPDSGLGYTVDDVIFDVDSSTNGANWNVNVTIGVPGAPAGAEVDFVWFEPGEDPLEGECEVVVTDGLTVCEVSGTFKAPPGKSSKTVELRVETIDEASLEDLGFEEDDLKVSIDS